MQRLLRVLICRGQERLIFRYEEWGGKMTEQAHILIDFLNKQPEGKDILHITVCGFGRSPTVNGNLNQKPVFLDKMV